MSNEKPVVVMGAAWYLMCRPETAFAWAETYVDLASTGQVYMVGAFDVPLPSARSMLVAEFMALPYSTHLLMIDADMHWRPAHIRRMLSHNEPIVAAVGADKRTGKFYAGKMGQGEGDRIKTPYDVDRGLIEVDRCGLCLVLIRRDAIEAMMAAHPNLHLHSHDRVQERLRPYFYAFFEHRAQDGWLPSEDFRFCDLAREAGLKIHVDPWIELSHIVPRARVGRLIDHLGWTEPPEEDAAD